MKTFKIIIAALALACFACTNSNKSYEVAAPNMPINHPGPAPVTKTVTYYKHIKDLKEVQELRTDYKYKYNIWHNKIDQVPDVSTHSKYFVIYTDHSHDEVSRDSWLNYSIGDSVAFFREELVSG